MRKARRCRLREVRRAIRCDGEAYWYLRSRKQPDCVQNFERLAHVYEIGRVVEVEETPSKFSCLEVVQQFVKKFGE